MDFKERLIRDFAEIEAKKLARKTVKYLQSLKGENLQSGDDSELINAWDEFCVQVQKEPSYYWSAYVETSKQYIRGYAELLPKHINQAIWLQTNEGFDWSLGNADEELDFFADSEEITSYVFDNFLIQLAENWSNERIARYLENG